MTLTWPLVLIVLFGALLHASWNALIKSGSDKSLDTALIHMLGVLIAIPLVATVGFPRAEAWPYAMASLVIHIGYYIALVGAYKHGELGLTYPIMRGLAPLLVAFASATFIGESLQPLAWIGVVAVSLGVVTVGLSRSAAASGHPGKALRYALANAGIIALYTVVDGLGVRASQNALAYVATLFLFDGIPYFLIVLWQRRDGHHRVFAYLRGRWKIATVGALASLGSYAIALWAMTRAPVATVAALRETSVLFAALIGAMWLKEGFGLQRAAGTVMIVAGVMTLRLS
jgi:phosphonate utilization associated putative membrane protein